MIISTDNTDFSLTILAYTLQSLDVELAIRLSSEEEKNKVGGSSLSLSQQHVEVSLWRTLNNCLRAFTRVTPKISRLSFQANVLMEIWQPQRSRGKAAI